MCLMCVYLVHNEVGPFFATNVVVFAEIFHLHIEYLTIFAAVKKKL